MNAPKSHSTPQIDPLLELLRENKGRLTPEAQAELERLEQKESERIALLAAKATQREIE